MRPIRIRSKGVRATNMDIGGMPSKTIWHIGPHLCLREAISVLSSVSKVAAEWLCNKLFTPTESTTTSGRPLMRFTCFCSHLEAV